ncbi:MAG: hypothetical protein WCP28_19560, partial [Actinomycetes bacterium]
PVPPPDPRLPPANPCLTAVSLVPVQVPGSDSIPGVGITVDDSVPVGTQLTVWTVDSTDRYQVVGRVDIIADQHQYPVEFAPVSAATVVRWHVSVERSMKVTPLQAPDSDSISAVRVRVDDGTPVGTVVNVWAIDVAGGYQGIGQLTVVADQPVYKLDIAPIRLDVAPGKAAPVIRWWASVKPVMSVAPVQAAESDTICAAIVRVDTGVADETEMTLWAVDKVRRYQRVGTLKVAADRHEYLVEFPPVIAADVGRWQVSSP